MSTDVIRNKVSTKHPKFGKLEATWTRDYSNVDREELVQLADRSVVIDQQAKARRVESREEFENFGQDVIDVREVLDSRRQRRTEEEKLADMLAKADPDALREALAAKGINVE